CPGSGRRGLRHSERAAGAATVVLAQWSPCFSKIWLSRLQSGSSGAALTALPTLFQRDKMTLGAKVARNVTYSTVRLFLLAPLPFILIPYFLKKLGPSGYGTWAVLLAISSLTSLADV